MNVVLATSNAGKAREARRILSDGGLEIVRAPIWLGEIETGTSYLENALIKASSAARLLPGSAVLAEDSGIEIDTLDGRPGIHSSRFAGPAATDDQNVDKVLALMSETPDGARTARYRAVAVLVLATGDVVVGEGLLEGSLIRERRGSGGFGYDPIFVPDGESRTSAELTADEKNAISHRGRALRELLAKL